MTRHCLAFCALLVMLAASPATASTTPPTLHFSTFVTTDLPLGDIVWTGSQFLYNAENLGKLETSDALGRNFKTFTSFDQGGEEMRCVLAPTAPKYWPVGIYCHTPDNRVVRFSTDGSSMTQLGTLPVIGNSDGSIAFDTVGKFGYGLLVASGGSASTGGQVFVLRRSGRVTAVGSYDGPGGAENLVVAPAKFGTAAGSALLSVDQDNGVGRLLAMDAHGNVKVLADKLPFGVNPIAIVQAPPARRAAGVPAAGLYLADTNSQAVWFTAAAGLKSYAGDVILGTEKPPDNSAHIWVVRPTAGGFETIELPTDLPSPSASWNFESAAYIP